MPEIVFIHIPKTAGMSFRARLHEVYADRFTPGEFQGLFARLGLRSDLWKPDAPWHTNRAAACQEWHRVIKEASATFDRMPFLAKHVPAALLAPVKPSIWVSLVRDPAERILSAWAFNRRGNRRGVPSSPWDFAALPHLMNLQSEMLGDLDAFDVVGTTDAADAFIDAVGQIADWPEHFRRPLERRNTAGACPHAASVAHLKIDPAWRDHVAKYHPLDVELFDKVSQRWAATTP